METIILIIGLAWAILNIILFFKLWGACNDIRDIANKFAPEAKEQREKENKKAEDALARAFVEDN